MVELQIKGIYGSLLTVDDKGVTFLARGPMASSVVISGQQIDFEEIVGRSFRPANIAINGRIEIVTESGTSLLRFSYGVAARAAAEGFARIVERTPHAGLRRLGRIDELNLSDPENLHEGLSEAGIPTDGETENPILDYPERLDAEKPGDSKSELRLINSATKQVAKAEKAEIKRETRNARDQAKRDRAAQILASYGRVAARAIFGNSTVVIYDKGFIRAGLFISDSTPFERLTNISYSRTVQDKSAGGRAAAAMATGGLSMLASNEKRDTFLSLSTERGSRTLKATGRMSESAGLSLESAGRGVLDRLRDRPAVPSTNPEVSKPAAARPATVDPLDQLQKLAQFHTQGVLTDEEFTAAKAKIMGL